MSSYLTNDDYLPYVNDVRLAQIIQNQQAVLDTAELTAITVIRDALHPKYDLDAIFSKVGSARDLQVVRWVITLVLYYLYERVPDRQRPQSVVDNYQETISLLASLENGKRSVNLPAKNEEPNTKFRWGSQPKRGHSFR